MKHQISLAFLIVLPTLALASDWFKGENLLTNPIPFSEEYELYSKEESGWISRLWKNKENDGDTYVVNIVEDRRPNLTKFRDSQDAPGKKACSSFSSAVINDDERNGYESVFWETNCMINDVQITSLQLAIAGRDSLYHVRKLWKSSVENDVKENWKDEISQISLCDTRKKKHPCPEGFEKVDVT
jgi:hypothetical protein